MWTPRKGICIAVASTGMVQYLYPTSTRAVDLGPPVCMFTTMVRGVEDGLDSRMVSVHRHFLTIEVATEVIHGPNYCKRFKLSGAVVAFRACK